jgi:hypothetical protein
MQKAKRAKLMFLSRGGTSTLICPRAIAAIRTDAVVPSPKPFIFIFPIKYHIARARNTSSSGFAWAILTISCVMTTSFIFYWATL